MDQSDRLSQLTRPQVEKLPRLEKQPPTIDTRYSIKSETEASVSATNEELHTVTWFRTPPLTAETIRMIRGVKLFAESHDQGGAANVQGNWTWFQLAIFSNKEATSPKKGIDGQELVVTSHSNKAGSTNFEWLEGSTFDTRRNLVKGLEAGNTIGVRLCARFDGSKIFAANGYLVIDIGEDNRPFPISPIIIDTNESIPVRRCVQKWYRESKTRHETGLQVSLFIRALQVFQRLPPENQLSWYRIGAIHGEPCNVPWNTGKPIIPHDDPKKVERIKAGDGGFYCQHNKDLFPTWHRGYLMLFERRVNDLMQEEAATRVKETKEWMLAAKRWRLPYWDWASDPTLPEIAYDKTIKVIKSWNGQGEPQMEVLDNPMYRFQMPGHKPMGDLSYGNYRIVLPEEPDKDLWEECIGTSRHTVTKKDAERKWVEGLSNAEAVNAALQGTAEKKHHRTLRDSVYRILTRDYATKYVRFASTKFDPKEQDKTEEDRAKGFLNLEDIHNTIHGHVGGDEEEDGGGHMASVPVAAFDPVFWLHHCNIDSLFHLWQTLNPSNWFHQKPGTMADFSPQQSLIPFHATSDPDDYYNSNQLRHIEALNYSYDYMDEITDQFGDTVPEKSHIYINELYGPDKGCFQYVKEEVDPVINVVYNRYAFQGKPYSLLFFLGELDKEVPWKKQRNLVGSVNTFSTFSPEDAVTCKNCYQQQQDNVLSRAQVPLTSVVPIARRVTRELAGAYFGKTLRWIAVHQNGQVADRAQLTELDMTLSCGLNSLISKSIKSRFKFGDYAPIKFDWDKAYALNSQGGEGGLGGLVGKVGKAGSEGLGKLI